MTEGWVIRHASSADAAEIARLAGLLGYPSDAAAILERLAGMKDGTDHWVAIATPSMTQRSRSLGGWMHVARHIALESGQFAELLGLVVDPAARRGGVGRLLVAEAERWAGAQHLTRLNVRSNAARIESHAFYPALGYMRIKTQHVYSKVLGEGAGRAI